jgi:hypothetical protein
MHDLLQPPEERKKVWFCPRLMEIRFYQPGEDRRNSEPERPIHRGGSRHLSRERRRCVQQEPTLHGESLESAVTQQQIQVTQKNQEVFEIADLADSKSLIEEKVLEISHLLEGESILQLAERIPQQSRQSEEVGQGRLPPTRSYRDHLTPGGRLARHSRLLQEVSLRRASPARPASFREQMTVEMQRLNRVMGSGSRQRRPCFFGDWE